MLHMLVALIAPLHVHVYCTHVVLHTLLISLARSLVNFVGNQEFRNSELGIELQARGVAGRLARMYSPE